MDHDELYDDEFYDADYDVDEEDDEEEELIASQKLADERRNDL